MDIGWEIGQTVWIIESNVDPDKKQNQENIELGPSEQEIVAFSTKLDSSTDIELCLFPYGWCSSKHVFNTEEACLKRAGELIEEAQKGTILMADRVS